MTETYFGFDVPDHLRSVRITKAGMPDKRHKLATEFNAWVLDELVAAAMNFRIAPAKSGVVRQALYLADKNGIATDIPNPDYVAVKR